MVYQLASAIAKSQAELDKSSIDMMRIMGDAEKAPVSLPLLDENGREIKTSMIGAGFQPAFYNFSDAIIEVKVAISSTEEIIDDKRTITDMGPSTTTKLEIGTTNRGLFISSTTTKVKACTIDARYTNKYNFSEEATSSIRVRLVPLPPNPIMQRMVELRAQKHQLAFELDIRRAELEIQQLAIDEAKRAERMSSV
jgi:hypothetical protein